MTNDFTLPQFDDSFLPVESLASLSPARRREIIERVNEAVDPRLEETVNNIINEVEAKKDEAVLEFTRRFDAPGAKSLVVTADEINAAEKEVSADLKAAFGQAYDNIYQFHKSMLPVDREVEIDQNRLGTIYRPVNSAAVYVPGGKALYPSTVLMGGIPARLAGVKDIVLITPPRKDGTIDPVVLWCAQKAGIKYIVKAGGAQAIAAVAFGTESVPKVDMVVGPGNIYVTLAKSILEKKGLIGIDSPAGPSEVVIIADEGADPLWLACDLLAQAEHDENATAILLTTSHKQAEQVRHEVYNNIKTKSERGNIKWQSIKQNGHILLVDSLKEAVEFSNEYGPEHLEVMTAEPENLLPNLNNAGSIFLGYYAPVAMGDYYSGTNHILPTGGATRRYSGLSAATFQKRITWQKISPAGLEKAVRPIELMSKAEGLYEEHGLSVEVRFKRLT